MKFPPLGDQYRLLERAALQERTAEMAAELAEEAERTGHGEIAAAMWTRVRRCRVQSLQLRAQAAARLSQE